MNDRFLFRGKRLDNGEMVQGYLFKIWDDCFILWGTTNGVPNQTKIDPATIGQCTGLKDKSGKLIFEGGRFHLGDPLITYIVVWHDAGFKGKQESSTNFIGLEYWEDRIELLEAKNANK